MKEKKWIYDLETFKYIFIGCFYNIETKEWLTFEISARKNETSSLREFLKGTNLIGYNNTGFDYPVLHHTILSNNDNWTSYQIYNEASRIIKSKYSSIWENQVKIPQLDLYKIWHYDNRAISTGLKWLEFAMRLDNVQDLPYKPDEFLSNSQMDEMIEYCKNDVLATYKFYLKTLDKIVFRVQMSNELKTNVMNLSDVAIGQLINQKMYEKLSGRKYWDFKDLRTYRSIYNIKDLIPDYIKFESDYLNNFLEEIRTQSFRPDDKFIRDLTFAGIDLTFAKGGLHSKDIPLDLQIEDDEILEEKDVGGMYPASIINGNFYPEHLGVEWNLGIKYLYDDRNDNLKPQLSKLEKGSDEYSFIDSKQNGFKLAMNGGGYGKTGDEYSWQYDPMVIMKTTFKGQLSLIMLIEQLFKIGVEIISANTDGVVVKYKRDIKSEVDRVHKEWEDITGYSLENTRYNRIIFRDVNNYLSHIVDDNNNHLYYKLKGTYEIDKDFHKNHSMRIVAIAAFNKFINGIEPEETLKNHLKGEDYSFAKNYGIFDFCIGAQMKGQNILVARKYTSGGIIDDKLSKVTRYYVSNEGSEMIKVLPPLEKNFVPHTDMQPLNQTNIFDIIDDEFLVNPVDRETNIESGYKCTVFNIYKDVPYDINYNYYLNECNKITNIF